MTRWHTRASEGTSKHLHCPLLAGCSLSIDSFKKCFLTGKKKKKSFEKWFHTGQNLSFLLCFNIPQRSKRTLIDLDICSLEISFFFRLIGIKKDCYQRASRPNPASFFFLFFLWGDRKGSFPPVVVFFIFLALCWNWSRWKEIKEPKPLNYNSSHISWRRFPNKRVWGGMCDPLLISCSTLNVWID